MAILEFDPLEDDIVAVIQLDEVAIHLIVENAAVVNPAIGARFQGEQARSTLPDDGIFQRDIATGDCLQATRTAAVQIALIDAQVREVVGPDHRAIA